MRRRGVVLELQAEHAIVLTSDGAFSLVPRSADMEVGAEVRWEAPDTVRSRRTKRAWRSGWYRVGAAAMAACLAIAAGVWFGDKRLGTVQAQAYAFVSIDINPSVSLQVSRDYVVLKSVGLNPDGVRLLQHLHLDGEKMDQAIQDIVNAAVTDNMLPPGDTILISTAPAKANDDVSKIKTQAVASAQTAVKHNPQAQQKSPQVFAIGLSEAVWKAADNAHISPGKLGAYLIAVNEGYQVSLNQLRGRTLGTVMSQQEASIVAQRLQDGDPQQLEEIINQLTNSQADSSNGGGNSTTASSGVNQGTTPGENTTDGTSSGDSGKRGDGHTSRKHMGITVQLGNSVFTVPVDPSDDPTDNQHGGRGSASGNKTWQSGGSHSTDGSKSGNSGRDHSTFGSGEHHHHHGDDHGTSDENDHHSQDGGGGSSYSNSLSALNSLLDNGD